MHENKIKIKIIIIMLWFYFPCLCSKIIMLNKFVWVGKKKNNCLFLENRKPIFQNRISILYFFIFFILKSG